MDAISEYRDRRRARLDAIGKDYFDVLEGFDQGSVPKGQTKMVGDWEYDPRKYD